VVPTYLEILNAIARELGQADVTKSPESERPELILRALRDADVLLVLDNLETPPAGGPIRRWVYFLRGQADAVLACADRAAAHWLAAQAGTRERTIAITLRGHGHSLNADYPAAIAAYREALELVRSSPPRARTWPSP
jgi:hypothetical protein